MAIAEPVFNVVIPVFNRSCVENAINSVRKQKYPNWNLIIVDDGSYDDTPLILCNMAQEDSRIRVISQPRNKGVSAARNAGIKYAYDVIGREGYLLFLDSDDSFAENAFCSLLNDFNNNDIDMICFNCERFSTKEKMKQVKTKVYSRKEIERDIVAPFLYGERQKEEINYRPIVWNKCIKMSVAEESDLHFDETMETWEDWTVCVKMFDCCNRLLMTDKIYIFDRFSDVSSHLSMKYYSDGAMNTLETYKWVISTFGNRIDLSKELTLDAYFNNIQIWIYRTVAKDKRRKELVLSVLSDEVFRNLIIRRNARGIFEKSVQIAMLLRMKKLAYCIYCLQNEINGGECF